MEEINLKEYLTDLENSTDAYIIGNKSLLDNYKLALLSSEKCPADILLKLFKSNFLNFNRTTWSSGFHSPVEKEVLKVMHRNQIPKIICPARGIQKMRIPNAWKSDIKKDLSLILSPFSEKIKRQTKKIAKQRNEFVAKISDAIFIPYASHGGKIEALAQKIIDWKKPAFTFKSEYTENLTEIGFEGIRPGELPSVININ